MIEELPIAPLYFYKYLTLTKPYINGVYITSAGNLLFDETYIERGKL